MPFPPAPSGVKSLEAGSGISVEDLGSGVWQITATGGGGGIESVVAGAGIAVDDTDPLNPIVSALGGGGGIASMTGAGVDSTPGIINQAGGMTITDAEGDGINFTSNTLVQFESTDGASGAVQLTLGSSDGNSFMALSTTQAGVGAQVSFFVYAGNPNGVVIATEIGDICYDNESPGVWQALDTDGTWIQLFNGTPEPTFPQSFGLSPGNMASPGVINQLGGMSITDTEADGFVVQTNGVLILISDGGEEFELTATGGGGITINTDSTLAMHGVGQAFLDTNGGGLVRIGASAIQAALTTDQSAVAFPFTVVIGVNDTFTYTPSATGTPEVFTVAPGVYAALTDIGPAITAAIGATSAEPFSTYASIFVNGLQMDWGGTQLGTIQNGDTITPGPTDITAGLDIANPSTFAGGVNGDGVYLGGGSLSFFNVGEPQVLQTVTGTLSAVTDPNAQAVLTSILAALATYGMVTNGTD